MPEVTNMRPKINPDGPLLAGVGNDELCRLFMAEELSSPLRFHYFKEIQQRGIKSTLKPCNDFERLKLDEGELLIFAARNGIPVAGNACTFLGMGICLFIWISIVILPDLFPNSSIPTSWLSGLIFISPWLYSFFIHNKILVTDQNIYFVRTFLGVVVFWKRTFPLTDCSVFSDTYIFFTGESFSKRKKILSKTFFIYLTTISNLNICLSAKNTILLFEIVMFLMSKNGGYFYKEPIYAQINTSLPTAYSSPFFYYKFKLETIDGQLTSFFKSDAVFLALPYIGKKILGKTSLERLALAIKPSHSTLNDSHTIPLAANEKILCFIPVIPLMSILTLAYFKSGFWDGFLAVTNARILYITKRADKIILERFFGEGAALDIIFNYLGMFRFVFSKKQTIPLLHFQLNLLPMLDLIQFVNQTEK